MMTTFPVEAELLRVRDAIAADTADLTALLDRRRALALELRAAGRTLDDIAAIAGVSRQRIQQLTATEENTP